MASSARQTISNAAGLLSAYPASDAGMGIEPRMLSTMIFNGHGCSRLAAMPNSVNTSPTNAARVWPRISDQACGQSLGVSFIPFLQLRLCCQIHRVQAIAVVRD